MYQVYLSSLFGHSNRLFETCKVVTSYEKHTLSHHPHQDLHLWSRREFYSRVAVVQYQVVSRLGSRSLRQVSIQFYYLYFVSYVE